MQTGDKLIRRVMLAHADEFFASNFHPIFKVNISITYKEIRQLYSQWVQV